MRRTLVDKQSGAKLQVHVTPDGTMAPILTVGTDICLDGELFTILEYNISRSVEGRAIRITAMEPLAALQQRDAALQQKDFIKKAQHIQNWVLRQSKDIGEDPF